MRKGGDLPIAGPPLTQAGRRPRLPGRHRHSGRRRPAVRGAPLPDSLRCADAGLVGSGDTCDNQVASVAPPSSVVTSMLPGPANRGPGRRAGRPRHRPVPRRTDHQDPPRGRRPLPPTGLRPDRRTGQRRTCLHRGHGTPARPSPPGRPRTRPDAVLADKAYSSRAIRGHLRGRGIRAVIPIRADQNIHRLRRGSRGGRPPAFDREAYKQRNTVERCINRLKHWGS